MKTTKISVYIAIAIFVFSGINTFGQTQKNVIKIHPLSLKMGYERMLNENMSLVGTAKFLPTNLNFNDEEGSALLSARTYNFSPELRFYFSKEEVIPVGFYLAPYLKGGYTSINTTVTSSSDTNLETNAKFKGSMLGGGAMAGWQWMMGSRRRFVIQTAIGWGINRYNVDEIEVTYEDGTQETANLKYANVWLGLPQMQFSLGYSF